MEKENIGELQLAIEKLANGINPFTGEIAGVNDILNDIRVSRCLFAANNILVDYLQGRIKQRRVKKCKFVYNANFSQQIKIENHPISLTKIIGNILEVYGEGFKLNYRILSTLLYEKGYLCVDSEHPSRLVASEKGKESGIISEMVTTMHGTHLLTFYNADAQRLVIDLLKELQ